MCDQGGKPDSTRYSAPAEYTSNFYVLQNNGGGSFAYNQTTRDIESGGELTSVQFQGDPTGDPTGEQYERSSATATSCARHSISRVPSTSDLAEPIGSADRATPYRGKTDEGLPGQCTQRELPILERADGGCIRTDAARTPLSSCRVAAGSWLCAVGTRVDRVEQEESGHGWTCLS
jgi:hypothetical protein